MLSVAKRYDLESDTIFLHVRAHVNRRAFAMLQYHIHFIVFAKSYKGENELAGWILQHGIATFASESPRFIWMWLWPRRLDW